MGLRSTYMEGLGLEGGYQPMGTFPKTENQVGKKVGTYMKTRDCLLLQCFGSGLGC